MIILYPGYSFETLSTDRTAAEAEQLLAAWSAAFHPALLEAFDEIPRWESASVPPYDISKQPIVIPPSCESYMQDDWFTRQEQEGGVLIRNLTDRREILERLFFLAETGGKGFDNNFDNNLDNGFDDEFVADCMALGTTYFLTDLLVRQLHYMSMVDDTQCSNHLFGAIRAYRQGNRETAYDLLGQAFDAICQSKEYFYPIKSYFVDLTLATSETLGEPFRQLLQQRPQTNLFLSSGVLKTLMKSAPESFDLLKRSLQDGKTQIVADDTEERSLLLLPILDAADRILEGVSIYRESLNISPTIYGRPRIGLTPFLPQILKLAGFKGAVHFAPLDGWHLNEAVQSKIVWQGVDGTKLDALVRYPLDASSASGFFELADRLGETINNDQAPTAVFARFPGQYDRRDQVSWVDDLQRMSRFSTDLGEFSPIGKYFGDTSRCGDVKRLEFEKYPDWKLRFDALSQAVSAGRPDPVSHWNGIHRESVRRNIRSAFETILSLLGRKPDESLEDEQIIGILAERISPDISSESMSRRSSTGLLVLNPWSFPRRAFVDVSHWNQLPKESPEIMLARQSDNDPSEAGSSGRKEIVVDVPPLGFVYVPAPNDREGNESPVKSPKTGLLGLIKTAVGKRSSKTESPLIRQAEDDLGKNVRRKVFLLQNEHFEAKIDATTGMLRSLFTLNSRFNRLSQQIGFRLPKEARAEDQRSGSDLNRGYAIGAADEIVVEQSGPITGRLRIRGRLVCPDGTSAAEYTETVTIRRRSRILEFYLTLEPKREPGDVAWDSYFALRRAWNDNTLDLRGGLADGSHRLHADRIQAPRFLDFRSEKHSLTFFSEGLPFHRRFGERKLDTILIPKGETERRFRYGIGVDLRYPIPASLEFFAPKESLIVETTGYPRNSSAWLFQAEAKNVVALHWEPLYDDENIEKPSGFRVFLLETEGRRARFALHSFLPPIEASSTNFFGEKRESLKIDNDAILIEMHGHELLPLHVTLR